MILYLDEGYSLLNTLIRMLYSDINSYEAYLALEALNAFFEKKNLLYGLT